MKKILFILSLFGVAGLLIGCATPGSLRENGPDLIFTMPQNTPQEFGNCLITQLEKNFSRADHTMRNKPNGDVSIYSKDMAGVVGEKLTLIFDISKTTDGSNISVYIAALSPIGIKSFVKERLNACGAIEKKL